MKVKNLTSKPIGFGSVVLLPDETAGLPKGFGPEHPTTKYYLSRKWIEVVGQSASGDAPASEPVVVSAEIKSGVDAENGGDKGVKSLSRMSLAELRDTAAQYGLDYTEEDTRNALMDKIKASIDVTVPGDGDKGE